MVRSRKVIQDEYAKVCASLSDEILKHSQVVANIEEAEGAKGQMESEIDRLKRLQLKLSKEYSKTPAEEEKPNEQTQPSN